MMVEVVKFLFEYSSVIICMHKVAGENIKISRKLILLTCVYLLLIFVGRTENGFSVTSYMYFIVYSRLIISNKWSEAIKIAVITFILIIGLQIVSYSLVFQLFSEIMNISSMLLISSVFTCSIVLAWKRDFWDTIWKNIKKIGLVAFILLLVWILFIIVMLKRTGELSDGLMICLLAIGAFVVLWISTEKKKQQEAEELRMYQIYTNTFEETVKTIRMRQHEFDNHINAIKYMDYSVKEGSDIVKDKIKYCEDVIEENEFNKLLKLNMSPIICGYLYSKFTTAKAEKNIHIKYDIEDINTEDIISVSDFVEITGILFDNAVEALKDSDDKVIRISMKTNEAGKLVLKIANNSRKYSNSEIEEFFKFGYSTKGKNRGVGLKRVKELTKKYKAEICVTNTEYENSNYLEFKITF